MFYLLIIIIMSIIDFVIKCYLANILSRRHDFYIRPFITVYIDSVVARPIRISRK